MNTKGGLPAATGATAALGVIGQVSAGRCLIDRSNHVSIPSSIVGEQNRMGSLRAEVVFTLDPKLTGHLRGMFTRRDAARNCWMREAKHRRRIGWRVASGRSGGHGGRMGHG